MTSYARLQVDQAPGVLRYRLEVPDHDGTSLVEFQHPVTEERFNEAIEQAAALLDHPEHAGFGERAMLAGQRLYRNLIPPGLREQLEQLRHPILLVTSVHAFPFELFHNGREFFGLQFSVGRRIITRRDELAPPRRQTPEGGRLELLVVASDPRGDLPFAQAEGEAIHQRLAESLGETANACLLLTSPSAHQAMVDDIAHRLTQGIDVLHYCGHIDRRKDGSVGLLLADQRLLSADDIANNLAGAPIVFLNACSSCRRRDGGDADAWRDDLTSMVGGFVRGGARAVIGTSSDVADSHAASLAEEFYRLTTAGVSLGEALRRARGHCRDKAPDSPAWLSFLLFGNPTQLFSNRYGVGPGAMDGHSRLAVLASVEVVDTSGAAQAAPMQSSFERIFRNAVGAVPGADVLSVLGCLVTARFTTASSAVGAMLRVQQQLGREWSGPTSPRIRIGIDLREVSEFDPDGTGTLRLVGAPAETAERLRTLAVPGQMLLSRSAFDGARLAFTGPASTHGDAESPHVQWLAHGQYFMDGAEEPVDVFEVGIADSAPLTPPPDSPSGRRRFESDEIAGWRPALGAPIPRRDNWVLERKLGEGGFGEVWLARHDRLREARVFKFCFDSVRLRSFRQETRIFRLLRDSLGSRSDVARLYDVELERPPYFLESEYVPHGNLAQWAQGKGGIGAVPLDVRLALFVQIADALSAAHSVGVLHKDLKPSNILIREDTVGCASPCLSDFGIGAVTDPARLLDLGITPTALATTAARDAQLGWAGTRLYAPPESQVGGAYTEKGDVYSLGVLLFQLVVGDFDRPLASGWERFIDDELLRTDVGTMVDGDPAARLSSAARAAELVGQLPQRRALLKKRQEAARRRQLTLRAGAALLVAVLSLGFALWTYRAREAQALERYRHTIQESLNLLNDSKTDETRTMLQAAPPRLRGWEWNYLWHAVNRIVYEGDPYRAVVLADGRLRVDTGGDDGRSWTGRAGIPLVPDDTLCFAWLSPGGNRVVSVPRATDGPLHYDTWDRVTGSRLGSGALRMVPSRSRPPDTPVLTNGCAPALQVVSNDDASHFVIGGSVVPVVIDAERGAPRGEVATPEDAAALRSFGFAIGDEGDASRKDRTPGIPLVSTRSPDRSLVATIGKMHDTLAVRDLALGHESSQVKVPSGAFKIEFSPRGDKILGLSWDQLWLWKVGDPAIDFASRLGDPSVAPFRSSSGVTFTGFNEDGSQAVAISSRFRIFDTSGRDRRSPLRSAHLLDRLSPGGRFGLDPRRDHVAVVDLSSAKQAPGLPGDVSGSNWVHAWFGDSDAIVSISRAGEVRVSDAATGRTAWSQALIGGKSFMPEQADFAANRIAVSIGDVVHVFEFPTLREVAALPMRGGGFDLSPDGLRMVMRVTGEDEGDGLTGMPITDRIELWDLATTTRVAAYHCGSQVGLGAVFSPDGRWLLTNCGLPTADIWDAKTGASVRRLSGFDGGIYSAEFSRDGRYVVTVGQWDSTVSVWKVESSARPTQLSIGQTKWSQASMSPDSRRVVGARGDCTVTVWDVATGKPLLTLGEPYQDDFNRPASAYFTADGTRIVLLCEDVTQIWGH